MSPTEFSNYIKQRAMQQQLHHSHNGHATPNANGHLGPIGPVSPARSLSPNPLSVAIMNGGSNGGNLSSVGMSSDPYYFPSSNTNGSNIYSPQQYGRNNLFDSNSVANGANNHYSNSGPGNGIYTNSYSGIANGGKYSPFLDTNNFYGLTQQQQHQSGNGMNAIGSSSPHGLNSMSNGHHPSLNSAMNGVNGVIGSGVANSNNGSVNLPAPIGSPGSGTNSDLNSGSTTGSKLLDGMNSFYSNSGPYQHLLVAN